MAVSVPGVPPPDVVHDGELYQSGEHEGGAGAHPDVQRLSEDHSSVLFRCIIPGSDKKEPHITAKINEPLPARGASI